MRHWVDILAPDGVTPLLTGVKAYVQDIPIRSGGAVFSEEQEGSDTKHCITVRANPLITSSCYVVYAGAMYIATGLADDGLPLRGRFTQIFARRINDGVPSPDFPLDGGAFQESQSESIYPVDGGTF